MKIMLAKEMFTHLLASKPPNLVKIKQKQNKLQFFIDNPLKNYLTILFFGGCVPQGMGIEVQ